MANEQTTNDSFNETLPLHKPVHWEDKEYTELRLDFDSMTGADLEQAEDEYIAMGKNPALVSMSPAFQRLIACKAASIPYEMTRAMSASDVSALAVRAQRFLLN